MSILKISENTSGILLVKAYKICARNIKAAVFKHIFLISNIGGIYRIILLRGAFNLVYRKAAVFLFQYAIGTVKSLVIKQDLDFLGFIFLSHAIFGHCHSPQYLDFER